MVPSTHSLDLFTLRVMALLGMLVVCGATMLAWRLSRRAAGLRLFALGQLVLAGAALSGLAGSLLGSGIGAILWSYLMLTGMIMIAQGIRSFRGFPRHSVGALALFFAGFTLTFCYLMLSSQSYMTRFGAVSAAYALLLSDAARSMLRAIPPGHEPIYRPTGIALAAAAVFLSLRTVGILSGRYGYGAVSFGAIEIGSTLCSHLANILCAFGLLLASNMQLRLAAEKMANFDPLTELPNRRLLLERLLEAEFRALSSGSCFALIYLDLDGFKRVNDVLGHEAGDQLLRVVSSAMTRILDSGHCLARVGGDEFVVLVDRTDSRDAIGALASRLKSEVETEVARVDPPVRLSYGFALFPDDGGSAHDIMRLADVAMYRSKREKRQERGHRMTEAPDPVFGP